MDIILRLHFVTFSQVELGGEGGGGGGDINSLKLLVFIEFNLSPLTSLKSDILDNLRIQNLHTLCNCNSS